MRHELESCQLFRSVGTTRVTAPLPWAEVDEATRQKYSPVAFKIGRNVCQVWGLERSQIVDMLGMTVAEFDRASEAPDDVHLTPAQFDRASLLIAIFRAIGELFGPTAADKWPRSPNSARPFDGLSAVQLMQAGGVESMKDVLRYLLAVGQGY